MDKAKLHNLPRLDSGAYRAFAAVHWTMNIDPPKRGWLNENFHHAFRELLLHACARERLFCPAYCLMPDHLHLIWLGTSLATDQLNGIKFFRTHLNRLLAGNFLENRTAAKTSQSQFPPSIGWKLQPQAHDHVLREEERKRGAFANVCFYILANPVRADLVKLETEWPFSGAIVPGYPDLYPFQEDYWDLFWKLYDKHKESTPMEPYKP